MSWSFRFGTKFHHNTYIKDVFYFSLRRSRTDYGEIGTSLFKNSSFEYIFDVDTRNRNFIKHFFLVGKKFPLKNRKITFSINTGFLWEGTDKYTGPLKRTDEDENFQILFRPNIEF